MTRQPKSMVPKVRFKGFTDEWEQRKVGELYKVTRGKVLATSKITPEKVGKNQYPVYSSQTKNDGLMGYYSDYLFDTAITWTTDGANAGTVNFRPGKFYSTNVNGVLLSADGLANKAMAENLNRSAWKWVSHVGNPKLMNNVMSEISVMIPVNLSEQEKISEFLMMIDNTIALQQHKLDQLNTLKKGLLQKMFADETGYPALRFEGFTEKWEQRKLGEEFQHINERNDGSFDNTRYISVANMYFKDPNEVQSNNILTRTYVMRRDDIAFEGHPSKKYKFGRFVANDIGDGVVSELFPVYRHVSKYDAKYWKYAIQIESIMAPLFAKSITSSGNSSNKLNPKHFLRQMVNVPDLNEQIKIGEFLSKFDAIITLHDKKIQYLKQLKRGLLQKMFV